MKGNDNRKETKEKREKERKNLFLEKRETTAGS